MKNYLQPGDVMTFTAPAGGVVSGTPVLIGSLVVVPVNSAAAAAPFPGQTVGVFTLPKAAGQVWAEGALLYFDSAAGNLTTAVGANTRRAGAAASVAQAPDLVGLVRLHGVPAPPNVA